MERHRLDALSLVFGLLFVAVGLLLLTGGPALGQQLPLEWVGPLVAIGIGVLLILAARPERPQGESATPDDGALKLDPESEPEAESPQNA